MKVVLTTATFLTIIATPALAQTYNPNMGNANKISNLGQYVNQAPTIDLTISTGITMNVTVTLPITASAITFGPSAATMVATTAATSVVAARAVTRAA